MISIDAMQEILEELVEQLPEVLLQELNGGILLLEETELAPEAVDGDLLTMGQYCTDPLMGRYIVLYYGSFVEACAEMGPAEIREEIKETLLHELTHHLEDLAGERGLEIMDELELADYLRSKHMP